MYANRKIRSMIKVNKMLTTKTMSSFPPTPLPPTRTLLPPLLLLLPPVPIRASSILEFNTSLEHNWKTISPLYWAEKCLFVAKRESITGYLPAVGCRHRLLLRRVHVGLGDALELVLLGGVAAGAALGGVDPLVGQALSARLWERFVFLLPLTHGRTFNHSHYF